MKMKKKTYPVSEIPDYCLTQGQLWSSKLAMQKIWRYYAEEREVKKLLCSITKKNLKLNNLQHHHRLLCSETKKKQKVYFYIKAESIFCFPLCYMNDLLKLALTLAHGAISRVSEHECRKCQQVTVLFPHVFLQVYSVAKARGSWRIVVNHLFSVLWRTSKLINTIPKERGKLAKDDLHKRDH